MINKTQLIAVCSIFNWFSGESKLSTDNYQLSTYLFVFTLF